MPRSFDQFCYLSNSIKTKWREFKTLASTRTNGVVHFPPVSLVLDFRESAGASIGLEELLTYNFTHTHTHTRLTAPFPGLPGWASTRKAKPIWILLKQEAVSGSGISLAICKSAPCSRQITMLAPHHSVFHRPDALPAAQPTASKHWRQNYMLDNKW